MEPMENVVAKDASLPFSSRAAAEFPVDQKASISSGHPAQTHLADAMDAAPSQFGFPGRIARHNESTTPPPHQLGATLMASPAMPEGEGDFKDPSGRDSHQLLHKCESCAKVYRHPSCLVKHRWEHTMYWKEASKFLMSKHQQVQLLEAAAILVGMDSNARSLPEEKALWPVNFDKLMASKSRSTVSMPNADGTFIPLGSSAPTHSAQSMRHGSEEIDMEEKAPGEESGELEAPAREDGYGLSSGGDVMADMDMDADE
ncbi:hypothetical protein MSPP1_002138 [Malassezia sp. CBS 17886]|nr:hypothetical protein MSPP1_002138 [Malassezia sp. CBS 17886]